MKTKVAGNKFVGVAVWSGSLGGGGGYCGPTYRTSQGALVDILQYMFWSHAVNTVQWAEVLRWRCASLAWFRLSPRVLSGDTPADLLFQRDSGELGGTTIFPGTGVHHGDALGPPLFCMPVGTRLSKKEILIETGTL